MDWQNGWRKVAVFVVSSIILGAIGSGLWELLGRAATQRVSRTLLDAITFGSNAMRDVVYREAARGPHEAAAVFLTLIVFLISFQAWTMWTAFLFGQRRGLAEAKAAENMILKVEDRAAQIKLIKAQVADYEKKKQQLLPVVKWSSSLISMLFAGMLLTNYLELSEASATYASYAQSLAICSPYISEQSRQLLASRYAGMQGKADYLSIMADLNRVAEANGRKLPPFTPW